MYEGRRYSLARYSISQQEKTVEIAERFSETMGALAGAAIPAVIRGRFSETLQSSARGTVSIMTGFYAAGSLAAAARMSADVLTRASVLETMTGTAHGKKNTPASIMAVESMAAVSWGAKNIPERLSGGDGLAARVSGSKNVPARLAASAVMTSMTEATLQVSEQTSLQVEIPPGGELRIDSGLFLALLDGQNVLYAQSGGWINLSRNLLRIIVESASGGQLCGSLIYTERYL